MGLSSGGGSIYCQATSSAQLVEKLRHLSGYPATLPVSHFMIQFANLIQQGATGRELIVRTDSTDHFVDDLIECGLLKIRADEP